ncbi:adenosylcobinamide-phosphate synthase CbiB [Enterococcus casseliflavus]|uniref:adenosylcobinamide-phosphate synthase CbiB n=1 Tax=Enterococcus casseliflavus TaxID=37734 RepID=UPI0022E1A717|nr:adenosylcobinamide-phosphate synthase CbiB [Enterococcus casseliflavus]MEB6086018.1 adenosylcobinamide-phosphate synthase CbiB [Enterococcus casseliflavus]
MILLVILAFLLDLILGDPYSWPHPVKAIGHFITFFQKRWNKPVFSETKRRRLGIYLWFLTIASTAFNAIVVLKLAYLLHPLIGTVLYVYLSYTTLAAKSLASEAKKVYQCTAFGTLEEARYQVSMIVGRSTEELTEEDITKAAIETVAENTTDGVIAPLMCLLIGGPVLALAYKAVNTLDSMVGYLTPKYQAFGWFSAKMDDWVNWVPARFTWVFLLLAAVVNRMDPIGALKIGWRDRRKHKSPNSGFPEAVTAGALGIQLGGTHTYHGTQVVKPTIGDPNRRVSVNMILKTNRLMYTASLVGLVILILLRLLIETIT